jgi:hypothetical protein
VRPRMTERDVMRERIVANNRTAAPWMNDPEL